MPVDDAPEILFSQGQHSSRSESERDPQANTAPVSHTDHAAHRSSGARLPESVEFVDRAGVRWLVSERDTHNDAGAHGDRCLVFASSQSVRRVWNYPSFWRELTPEALATLSWRT